MLRLLGCALFGDLILTLLIHWIHIDEDYRVVRVEKYLYGHV